MGTRRVRRIRRSCPANPGRVWGHPGGQSVGASGGLGNRAPCWLGRRRRSRSASKTRPRVTSAPGRRRTSTARGTPGRRRPARAVAGSGSCLSPGAGLVRVTERAVVPPDAGPCQRQQQKGDQPNGDDGASMRSLAPPPKGRSPTSGTPSPPRSFNPRPSPCDPAPRFPNRDAHTYATRARRTTPAAGAATRRPDPGSVGIRDQRRNAGT